MNTIMKTHAIWPRNHLRQRKRPVESDIVVLRHQLPEETALLPSIIKHSRKFYSIHVLMTVEFVFFLSPSLSLACSPRPSEVHSTFYESFELSTVVLSWHYVFIWCRVFYARVWGGARNSVTFLLFVRRMDGYLNPPAVQNLISTVEQARS